MSRKERLIYVPLGGAGEIGMNMYLYGLGFPGKEYFIMIDAGVTFPDMESSPGVNLIMPDDTFIKSKLDRLLGIFISHAHEDHVGAIASLYGNRNIPIYSRKFTGEIIRQKLSNSGYEATQLNIIEAFGDKVRLEKFEISFIPIPHSIPESSALLIETPIGNIFHSGDFKMDPSPVIGDSINYDLLASASKKNIAALMCDSTNVFSKNPGRSESLLQENFDRLFETTSGLVVATTFASNLSRLKIIANAASKNDRQVCVLGRAMNSMIKAANKVGILDDFPETVSPKDARKIPRERLLILATGSQGEVRAASAQLSKSSYMNFQVGEGDTFIFSSKTIPGNEIAVTTVVNRLAERGVDVIYEENDDFHVSGHPNEPDLRKIHKIINPKSVIPIHGEYRHLKAHCDLAKNGGYESMIVSNGMILEINKEGIEVVDNTFTGRIFLDGSHLVSEEDKVISDRLRLAKNGICTVSIIIENGNKICDSVWIETIGLPQRVEGQSLDQILEKSINSAFSLHNDLDLSDDESLESFIKNHLSKRLVKEIDKRPLIQVLISRMD